MTKIIVLSFFLVWSLTLWLHLVTYIMLLHVKLQPQQIKNVKTKAKHVRQIKFVNCCPILNVPNTHILIKYTIPFQFWFWIPTGLECYWNCIRDNSLQSHSVNCALVLIYHTDLLSQLKSKSYTYKSINFTGIISF